MRSGMAPRDALSGVLESFATIIDDSRNRSATSEPAVIVALLAERERFRRLLSELFRTGDGVLVDATELGDGVDTHGDVTVENPELVGAVQALLDAHNSRHSDAGLRIDASDGRAVVTGNHELGSANTGQRALREVLTALMSSDLTAATLAGLLWADDSLDETESDEVWSLLMRAGELLRVRPGSTLVLMAGDAVLRPAVHCSGPVSVRYNLHGRGVDERRASKACRIAVEDLANFDEDDAPLVVLFLAAGAVTGLGLPLGNDMRNSALARQVKMPTVDSSNYDRAARAFFERLEAAGALRKGEMEAGVDQFIATLTLERVLQAEQAQENQRDSKSIRLFREDHDAIIETLAAAQARGEFDDDGLVRMLSFQRRIVLVTVNFDRTIETKAPMYVKPFVTEAELAGFSEYVSDYRVNGGRVPLLKLHGDIGVLDSIVANVDETAAGLSNARVQALDWLVTEIQRQRVSPWWYVGYSMRDLDLESTWANASFASKMAERWVAPFVDPSVRRFIEKSREPRWGRDGKTSYSALERTITMVAEEFFAAVADDVIPVWSRGT